jgi:hypothetical protein
MTWIVLRAWFVLGVLMTANGILRELVLRRHIGVDAAGVVSLLLGAGIILVGTRHLLRALTGASHGMLAVASLTLVVLTVLFEFTFGHWVDGKPWSELAAAYAIWRGEPWLLLLTLLALTPFIWGRWWPTDKTHA